MRGTIRLACRECDRDDFDGVDELPADWTDIVEDQPLAEARREVAAGDRLRSVFEWHTHLGLCPDCQQIDSA